MPHTGMNARKVSRTKRSVKQSEVTKTTDIAKKTNSYAEEKYRTNQAAAGEAGLLCDVSAGGTGTETSTPAP